MGSLDVDGLQRLLWSFASHRVLTVAARTGLLRALAGPPRTPAEVARELGLDALATGKIVRALNALGVLEPSGPSFSVVPSLAPYFQPGDHDLVPLMEHSHRMYSGWGENLEPWLRGDGWPHASRTPAELRVFSAAMRAMGGHVARRVSHALDLAGVATMLDVGGGLGHYARALCEAAPSLRAVVLDRPEVVTLGRAEIAGTTLEDRLIFVAGDYLEDEAWGEGFDLVLLANVLHQESAGRAATMVRRAARALAPGGRVAIVDFRIDDHRREHLLGTLFAINMREFGDTWTEPDLRGWLQAASLDDLHRTDIGPDRWLLTGRASRLRRP